MNRSLAPGFRRSLLNVLSTWGVQGASVVFALVVVPLVSRRFGVEGLGLWLLIQQLAGHLQLFEMGLNSSLGRYLARSLALGEKDAHDGYLSSAFAVLCVLAVTVMLVTFLLAAELPAFFDIPTVMQTQAVWMFVVVGSATALSLPMRAGLGVLSSRHRFDLMAFSEGLGLGLKVILVLGVCLTDVEPGLVLLAGAVFLPMLLGSCVAFVHGLRCPPVSCLRWSLVSRAAVRALFDISLSALVVTAAAVLLRQGTPVIIGMQFGVGVIPMLAIPLMIVSVIQPFVAVANKLLSPVASQFDAVGDRQELLSAFRTAAHYTLTMAILVFVLTVAVGREALTMWLGHSGFSALQLDELYRMLLIVFGGYCVTLPGAMGRTLLGAVGRHWAAARGEMVGTLVGLVLGVSMIMLVGTGPWGMALGVVAAYVTRAVGSAVRLIAEYFDTSQGEIYRLVWGLPTLIALPMFAGLFVVFASGMAGWEKLSVLFVCILAWAWAVLRFLVTEAHRARLGRLLKL